MKMHAKIEAALRKELGDEFMDAAKNNGSVRTKMLIDMTVGRAVRDGKPPEQIHDLLSTGVTLYGLHVTLEFIKMMNVALKQARASGAIESIKDERDLMISTLVQTHIMALKHASDQQRVLQNLLHAVLDIDVDAMRKKMETEA